MSAATAVFDTTELFEEILVKLDTKTLLLAQRVEKRWQQVIKNSKPLQRKLFFMPTTTFDDIINLGLLDTADSEKYSILDATSNRCRWLQQVVILNDILFDTTREWKLRDVSFANPHSCQTSLVEPSWKRMLLTQPPPSTGRGDVMFWFEDAHNNDELCEEVDTMGQMMQQIYDKENSVNGFDIHWPSAAVRPVKHAVDGTYYLRLLNQRNKEEAAVEELMEVTIFDSKGNIEVDPSLEGLRTTSPSIDGQSSAESTATDPIPSGPSSCLNLFTCKDAAGVPWNQASLPCEALAVMGVLPEPSPSP